MSLAGNREKKKRARITNLGLFLATTVVALLLAEFGARLFVPQWAPFSSDQNFWMHDDLLGWAHKPNRRGVITHRDFSTEVSINSQGLRDDEYPLDRVEGKKRMLVLGDSFGWGYGVEHEQTFTEILEAKYPGWEIINASVNGYGTDQEFLYLRERGIHYQPDVVLLLFCDNDVNNNNSAVQYDHRKPMFRIADGELVLANYPVPRPSPKQRLVGFVNANTFFFSRLYLALNAIGEQLPGGSGTVGGGSQAGYDVTERLLLSLNDLTVQNGVQLVVASVPTEREEIRDNLAETTHLAGIPYLPLDEAFSNAPKEEWEFGRDCHWNPTGHQIAAEAVEDFLIDIGVFP